MPKISSNGEINVKVRTMKVLVAGGSGLVGSAIFRKLNIYGIEALSISSKDVDLLNREATFQFLERIRPDVVIDAAAKVGGIGANDSNPVDFLSDNLRIQTNLIDASHEFGVEKVIFLGSSCIYPKHAKQPIKESELLNGYLEPTNSAYAIAKIAGIELIKSYRKQYNHKWISLMPANLYGPGDNFNVNTGHVLPSLLNKFHIGRVENRASVELWGDGSAFREFLHVDDLADAVVFCLDKYDEEEHLNIGSGQETSIKDLAGMVKKSVDFQGMISWDASKPNGTPRKILDSSRIISLGWKPKIDLQDGINQTYKWFIENPDRRV
jgi:GDP-L-fucose synthase